LTIDKEGEKERLERENCNGHHHNILLSHLAKDGRIGPCGFTRIVNFKVLVHYSKTNCISKPLRPHDCVACATNYGFIIIFEKYEQ
jgi:hypothetical protein